MSSLPRAVTTITRFFTSWYTMHSHTSLRSVICASSHTSAPTLLNTFASGHLYKNAFL